ncbi:MAG: hypothetical protein HZC28_00890 [Spirochaetes bacterium]|nr:hypothetical protein [Spirochaetota bacterium]
MRVAAVIIACAAMLHPYTYQGMFVSAFAHYGNPERQDETVNNPKFDYYFTENIGLGIRGESTIPYMQFLTGYLELTYISSYENRNFTAPVPNSSNGGFYHQIKDNGFSAALGVNLHDFSGWWVEPFIGIAATYAQIKCTTNITAAKPYPSTTLHGLGTIIAAGIMIKVFPPYYFTGTAGMHLQYYTDGTPVAHNAGTLTSTLPAGTINYLDREFFFTVGASMKLTFDETNTTTTSDKTSNR